MFEDVPSKVREFFKRRRLNPTLRRARASIGLQAGRGGLLRYLTTGRPRGRSYARSACRQYELAVKPGIT